MSEYIGIYDVRQMACLRMERRGKIAERGACDYIAGMSDRFAKNAYMNIFVPKSWEE